MISLEKAYVMDPEEIKEMMDETSEASAPENADQAEVVKPNPTIERLAFIEAKAASGKMMIYPCFLAGYSEEPTVGPVAERPKLIFYVYIVQCMKGDYGLLYVAVKEDELGKTKRIWDRPPKKSVREETPWVTVSEAGVQ